MLWTHPIHGSPLNDVLNSLPPKNKEKKMLNGNQEKNESKETQFDKIHIS